MTQWCTLTDDAVVHIDEALFLEVYGGFLVWHSTVCNSFSPFFVN